MGISSVDLALITRVNKPFDLALLITIECYDQVVYVYISSEEFFFSKKV